MRSLYLDNGKGTDKYGFKNYLRVYQSKIFF